MNKWIKLDKNNLPSDILVEGKYEFRGFAPMEGAHFIFTCGLSALADIDINRRVEYRKKAIDPKVFTARVVGVQVKTDQSCNRSGIRFCPTFTLFTIKIPGYANLAQNEDMTVTFSPID